MLLTIFLLFLWFVLLLKWSDFFVDGASAIARRFRLSQMFIWLTIVAFGTSAPELFVNIQSALHWHTDLALWNILWSNIANIALILWIGIIVWAFAIAKKISKDILISIVFALWFLALLMIWGSEVSRLGSMMIGLVLLWAFWVYFWYTYRNRSSSLEVNDPTISHKVWILILMIVWWLCAILFGGELVVNNAVKLAEYFGVSARIIGLTIVSVGTSLPELMTTIVSLKKWYHEIGVGNIIWSNIFNIWLIGGMTSLVSPIVFEWSSYYDFFILILISLILFWFVSSNKDKMKTWQWLTLFVIYIVYIVSLIIMK
jgi:cation:H+ antiporter